MGQTESVAADTAGVRAGRAGPRMGENGATTAAHSAHILPAAVYAAVIQGNTDVATRWIQVEKGNVQAKTQDEGWTLLHACCVAGLASYIPTLIQLGAHVNAVNDYGATPLYCSAVHGHLSCAQTLLHYGADASIRADTGKTALDWAILKRNTSFIELIEQSSASKDFISMHLIAAAEAGKLEAIRSYIGAGGNPNAPCEASNESLLAACCRSDHVELCEYLLQHGADPNLRFADGDTPLLVSCVCQSSHCVTALLRAGAKCDICDQNGYYPIDIAMKHGNHALISLLHQHSTLFRSVDTNFGHDRDSTAPTFILSLSTYAHALQGDIHAMEAYLSQGGYINAVTEKDERTLLHAACIGTQYRMCEFLLKQGISIDLQDLYDQTALHYAVERTCTQCVEVLCLFGADKSVKNCDGESAVDLAMSCSDMNVQESLLQVMEMDAVKKQAAGLNDVDVDVDAVAERVEQVEQLNESTESLSLSELVSLLKQSPYMIPSKDLEVGKLLGKGSYGQVRLGSWCGVPVAIKQLHSAVLSLRDEDDEYSQQFLTEMFSSLLHEMEVLTKMHHPNTLRVYGCCVDWESKDLSIVTEFCSGGSLYDWIHPSSSDTKPLTLLTKLDVLMDVARGLMYIHNRTPPIKHLDLKLANILLDVNGTAKLADFGEARIKANDQPLTNQQPVGTEAYMAPEVIQGEQVTTAADIYSFAICMWEVITQQLPYEDVTPRHKLTQLVVGKHLRPTIPSYTHPKIAQLIRQCWLQQATQRPTADQILQKLLDIKHLISEE